MKKVLMLLVLSASAALQAQISLPESVNPLETGTLVEFRGNYDAQSSSLNNGFNSLLLNGGVITTADVDAVFSKQKSLNRLGRDYSAGIFVAPMKMKFFGREDFSWAFEGSFHSFLSANFSDDAFGLTFYGNSRYLGDSAVLDGTYFQTMTWQSVGAGFMHKKTKSYFTLNVANVSNSYNGLLNEGHLYSAADSTQLNLGVDGTVDYTYKYNFSQGIGVSANFAVNYFVPRKDNENIIFQLKVQQLGAVYLPDVVRNSADTTIQYDGFTFKELLGMSGRDYSNFNWYDTLQVKVDTLSVWKLLPTCIQISKILNTGLNQRFQAFYGVKVYPFIKYIPKVYVGLDAKLYKNFRAGASAAYGGFGNFRMGLYANYSSDKWYAGIGTEDVYGLLSKSGFGKMFNFRLVCVF